MKIGVDIQATHVVVMCIMRQREEIPTFHIVGIQVNRATVAS